VDDNGTIGARIRALRRWRGKTVTALADEAGISTSYLSMAERGLRTIDRRSHIAALAAALQVSETELVGGPHLPRDRVQSDPHAYVPRLRIALQTNTLKNATVDHARPIHELADLLRSRIERCRRACDYVAIGELLPDVLDELHLHIAAPADEAVQRFALQQTVDACNYASVICKSLNYPDLAYFASVRGDEAARMLDDPVAIGKAAFPLIQNAPREAMGWNRVLRMAERSAGELQRHARNDLGLQVLGMLTLNAALAAAAELKLDAAEGWMAEARSLAGRLPDDTDHAWLQFSRTNVAIWEVSVGVECGYGGQKVRHLAESVDRRKIVHLPSRQSIFFSDTGRGLARDPKTRDEALIWLREAESAAPQRIRNNLKVREAVTVLLEQARTATIGRELRGMAARMGVPH
jgi:transcriptional regulator with XRE-family HTH domain